MKYYVKWIKDINTAECESIVETVDLSDEADNCYTASLQSYGYTPSYYNTWADAVA
jgi:hypothetical protein